MTSWGENTLTTVKKQSSPPSTPKKRPSFPPQNSRSARRVKSITRLVEKESSSGVYWVLVVMWGAIVAGVLLMTFAAKLKGVENSAELEVSQCRRDYESNRCHAPVAGIKTYCAQKLACMNSKSGDIAQRKVNYVQMAGQVVRQFANGAGLAGVAVGLTLIWLCLRHRGKEKSVLTMEFYDDNQ